MNGVGIKMFFTSKEKKFWDWFSNHKDELIEESRADYNMLLDNLLEQLHRYCKNIFLEIGSPEENKMELIITANGDKTYFNMVEALVNNAPKFNNWIITAFKPPMERKFNFKYEGINLDTNEIWFEPLANEKEPTELGIQVFVDSFDLDKKDIFDYAIYIVLETILGEKSFAEDINYLKIDKLEKGNEKYISIKKLPEYILWHKQRKE
jgi:hypothetical protein